MIDAVVFLSHLISIGSWFCGRGELFCLDWWIMISCPFCLISLISYYRLLTVLHVICKVRMALKNWEGNQKHDFQNGENWLTGAQTYKSYNTVLSKIPQRNKLPHLGGNIWSFYPNQHSTLRIDRQSVVDLQTRVWEWRYYWAGFPKETNCPILAEFSALFPSVHAHQIQGPKHRVCVCRTHLSWPIGTHFLHQKPNILWLAENMIPKMK